MGRPQAVVAGRVIVGISSSQPRQTVPNTTYQAQFFATNVVSHPKYAIKELHSTFRSLCWSNHVFDMCHHHSLQVLVHVKQGLCWECATSTISGKVCHMSMATCFVTEHTTNAHPASPTITVHHQVRSALRMRGALQWNDRVLVALSGGPSSWVALHALLSMHAPDDQRPGKNKVCFGCVCWVLLL